MKTTSTKLTTKLGTAKGLERSRIWIEGDRLLANGFTTGTVFVAQWKPAALVLRLCQKSDDLSSLELRTVSGKQNGAHPIIDIVGRKVLDTFGAAGSTHVNVTFESGYITIRRCEK